MRFIEDFPHAVREVENTWIGMPDGTRLAARIWLPDDAASHPVPAILEYIPYRKNDIEAYQDSLNHRYFAGHGYAGVRVDLRGSGDSGGVLEDEYLARELEDGEAVIRWIAEQPWCDGNVGMMGISWGGFNGLQLAARQPPALKAVITVCSTDDRYADDVHHMGGCLLGDNLSWASIMFAFNSLPPDPAVVGEKWRTLWQQRLEGSGLWLDRWLRHQRRDAYWRHGSVCEDYAAIRCPVMAISGWADGYSNAVFRLLANLEVPRLGLIGPWSHKYPHLGRPGPAIGFLQEAVRWWDEWLKDQDTGVAAEPMLRAWMQESVPPTTHYDVRPGRWVAETAWPSPRISNATFRLGHGRLRPEDEATTPGDKASQTIRSPLSVGLFAGKWCSYAAPPDLPHDQREEDGGALVFETAPLEARIEILGAPVAELVLSSDRPVAMVALRVSDVAPDHKATRVTYGLLNLTHRDSREHPQQLVPGERYRVRVRLNEIAQAFPAGHRIRLSLSTSYWPLAWPPPEPAMLTIEPALSRLVLPIRPHRDEDARLRPFGPPEAAVPVAITTLVPGAHRWVVHRDLVTDESSLEVLNDQGSYRIERSGLEVERRTEEWYSYQDDEFTSVRGETRARRALRRPGWAIHTQTHTVLTSSVTHFRIEAELTAYEGEECVTARKWDVQIPRDLV